MYCKLTYVVRNGVGVGLHLYTMIQPCIQLQRDVANQCVFTHTTIAIMRLNNQGFKNNIYTI